MMDPLDHIINQSIAEIPQESSMPYSNQESRNEIQIENQTDTEYIRKEPPISPSLIGNSNTVKINNRIQKIFPSLPPIDTQNNYQMSHAIQNVYTKRASLSKKGTNEILSPTNNSLGNSPSQFGVTQDFSMIARWNQGSPSKTLDKKGQQRFMINKMARGTFQQQNQKSKANYDLMHVNNNRQNFLDMTQTGRSFQKLIRNSPSKKRIKGKFQGSTLPANIKRSNVKRHALKVEDFNQRDITLQSMGFQLRDGMDTGGAFTVENEPSVEQLPPGLTDSPFMVHAEELGESMGSEFSQPEYNIKSPPAANYLYRDFQRHFPAMQISKPKQKSRKKQGVQKVENSLEGFHNQQVSASKIYESDGGSPMEGANMSPQRLDAKRLYSAKRESSPLGTSEGGKDSKKMELRDTVNTGMQRDEEVPKGEIYTSLLPTQIAKMGAAQGRNQALALAHALQASVSSGSQTCEKDAQGEDPSRNHSTLQDETSRKVKQTLLQLGRVGGQPPRTEGPTPENADHLLYDQKLSSGVQGMHSLGSHGNQDEQGYEYVASRTFDRNVQQKLENPDSHGKKTKRYKSKKSVESNNRKQPNLDLLHQLKRTSIALEYVREKKEATGALRVTVPGQAVLRESVEAYGPAYQRDQAIQESQSLTGSESFGVEQKEPESKGYIQTSKQLTLTITKQTRPALEFGATPTNAYQGANMGAALSNRLRKRQTERPTAREVKAADDTNMNQTINFQDSRRLTSAQRRKILVTITSQQTPSVSSNNLTGTEKSFRLKFKKATQGGPGSTATPFEARVFGAGQVGENTEGSARMSVFSASKDEHAQDVDESQSYRHEQENDAFRKQFFDLLKAENPDHQSVASAASRGDRAFLSPDANLGPISRQPERGLGAITQSEGLSGKKPLFPGVAQWVNSSQGIEGQGTHQFIGDQPLAGEQAFFHEENGDISIADLMSTVKNGFNQRRQTLEDVQTKALREVNEVLMKPIKTKNSGSRPLFGQEGKHRYRSVHQGSLRGAVTQNFNGPSADSTYERLPASIRVLRPLDPANSSPGQLKVSPSESTAGGLRSPFQGPLGRQGHSFTRKRKTLNEADYSHAAKMLSQRSKVYEQSSRSPVSYRKTSLIQINENIQEHNSQGPFCPRSPQPAAQVLLPLYHKPAPLQGRLGPARSLAASKVQPIVPDRSPMQPFGPCFEDSSRLLETSLAPVNGMAREQSNKSGKMSPWSLGSRQYLHLPAQKQQLMVEGLLEEPHGRNQAAAQTGSSALSPASPSLASPQRVKQAPSPLENRTSTPGTALSGLQNQISIYHLHDQSREDQHIAQDEGGPESAARRPVGGLDIGTELQEREDGQEPAFRQEPSGATQGFVQFRGPGRGSIQRLTSVPSGLQNTISLQPLEFKAQFRNLKKESETLVSADGPTPILQVGSGRVDNEPENRSLAQKKLSLNQYTPAYVLEDPGADKPKKVTLRQRASRRNSPQRSPGRKGNQNAITLEVQLRTVDAKNNLHARNPSTKAPDVGLMAVSTSREVFKNQPLPAGLKRTGDAVSQKLWEIKLEKKEAYLRFVASQSKTKIGSNAQFELQTNPYLRTLPYAESLSGSKDFGAIVDPKESNANLASRLSLVTINEGDGSAGAMRLSERGYSQILLAEGQYIHESPHRLTNQTKQEGREQERNLVVREDHITHTEKSASDDNGSDRDILATVIVLQDQKVPWVAASVPASLNDAVEAYDHLPMQQNKDKPLAKAIPPVVQTSVKPHLKGAQSWVHLKQKKTPAKPGAASSAVRSGASDGNGTLKLAISQGNMDIAPVMGAAASNSYVPSLIQADAIADDNFLAQIPSSPNFLVEGESSII